MKIPLSQQSKDRITADVAAHGSCNDPAVMAESFGHILTELEAIAERNGWDCHQPSSSPTEGISSQP